MVSRERILEAAARVYAKHGFKGATTRLIANEAGVNEVTLFRTFGSKGALLQAVLLQEVGCHGPATLPDDPHDPPAELRDFIDTHIERISAMRPLLIQTMGEAEDRPEAQEFACRGRQQVHAVITTYLRHLASNGWVPADLDIDGAAVLLTGAIISDVMGRPIIGHIYPPREEVADRYTRLFLRAIGYAPRLSGAEEIPNLHSASGATSSRDSLFHPLHSSHS